MYDAREIVTIQDILLRFAEKYRERLALQDLQQAPISSLTPHMLWFLFS